MTVLSVRSLVRIQLVLYPSSTNRSSAFLISSTKRSSVVLLSSANRSSAVLISPANRGSAFLISALPVHSTSFLHLSSSNKVACVVNNKSDFYLWP